MNPALFGKNKQAVTLILGMGKEADGDSKEAGELEIVAKELIDSIHEKDIQKTVYALQAAFQCMEADEKRGENNAY